MSIEGGGRNDVGSLAEIRALAKRLASGGGDAPVSPTPEKKSGQRFRAAQKNEPGTSSADESKGSRRGGNGKELSTGEIVRLERDGAEFLDHTSKAIEAATGIGDLMKLVTVVDSRSKQKQKLSFPMGRGIPQLLSNGGDFSKKFDALFETWQTRVVVAIFDHPEYGENHFRAQLIERKKDGKTLSKENFFKEYLEQIGFPQLILSPKVVEKMEGIWTEQKQAGNGKRATSTEKKKDSPEETFSRLVAEWRKLALPIEFIHENGRKLIVTEVSDARIKYDHQGSPGAPVFHLGVSAKQIFPFLEELKTQFSYRPFSSRKKKEVVSVDASIGANPQDQVPVNVADAVGVTRPDGEPNAPVKPLSKQKGKGSSSLKRQSPPPLDMDDAVFGARNADAGDLEDDEKASAIRGLQRNKAVAVATPTPQEAIAKSLERTYDELFKEADDGPYHGILFGAAAAGFLTMKEGAEKESVDLKAYDKDHPGEILEALIDGMKDSFHRVGKKLGWSESETNIYARGLVQKSIEKYLK